MTARTGDHPRRPRAWPGDQHSGRSLVGTLALTEITSYGVVCYAFSVFLLPMQQDLGWSRTALTGAYSLAIILSGISAVFVGRWLDHHGARGLMTAGSCAATILLLAWSQVTTLAAFYAVWAGIGIVMAAILYEPAFTIIATWFRTDSERTRALLALTVIAGFASVIYTPLTGWLVEAQGWRVALIILAVLLGTLTILPHSTLPAFRPRLREGGAHGPTATASADEQPAGISLPHALRDQTLWWLVGAFVAATLATTTVTVHLVVYLHEQDYSAGFAAVWTGLIGGMSVLGRIVATILGRRWSLAIVTAVMFGLQALAVALLVALPGPAGVVLFVILFGVGVGLISLTRASLVASVYGVAAYASINGVLVLPLTIARAAAPVAASALRTATGNYQLVMAAVALTSVFASLAMIRAHRWTSRQVRPLASSAEPHP